MLQNSSEFHTILHLLLTFGNLINGDFNGQLVEGFQPSKILEMCAFKFPNGVTLLEALADRIERFTVNDFFFDLLICLNVVSMWFLGVEKVPSAMFDCRRRFKGWVFTHQNSSTHQIFSWILYDPSHTQGTRRRTTSRRVRTTVGRPKSASVRLFGALRKRNRPAQRNYQFGKGEPKKDNLKKSLHFRIKSLQCWSFSASRCSANTTISISSDPKPFSWQLARSPNHWKVLCVNRWPLRRIERSGRGTPFWKTFLCINKIIFFYSREISSNFDS